MNRIKIEKIENEKDFAALESDWQRLFAVSDCAPFLSFEWLSVWWANFGEGRKLSVLRALRGDQTVGILPLYFEKRKVVGLNLHAVGLIGEAQGGADYLDLIARRQDKNEILTAMFEYLKSEKGFDLIQLEGLSKDSPTVEFLQNSGEKHLRAATKTAAICPQINLAGGWEKVLKESRRADNFKRRLKKLEKHDGFEFRTITAAAEISAAFERFFDLHEKRWAADGGSELSGHPRLAAFQREAVVKTAHAGLVRFDEIWAEGACRASVYGFDNGTTFYYYNAGYDLDWANRSVGLVLIGLSVKNAAARGIKIYDFLRGEETYKFDWANGQNELVNIVLRRPTFPATAHGLLENTTRSIRNFSKNALPQNLLEPLKKWQRNRQRIKHLKTQTGIL